ncbi:MAG: helix-hairpin-helix domain-containing protein, partial [Planctomycetota bacterium]
MAKLQPNSAGIESWLKLIRADGVGPATFAKLIKRFGSAESVLGASVSELAKVEGLGFKTAERIASTRDKFDAAAELELAQRHGVWLINLDDERYPPVLRRIYDPPPVLYVKGSLSREDNLALS